MYSIQQKYENVNDECESGIDITELGQSYGSDIDDVNSDDLSVSSDELDLIAEDGNIGDTDDFDYEAVGKRLLKIIDNDGLRVPHGPEWNLPPGLAELPINAINNAEQNSVTRSKSYANGVCTISETVTTTKSTTIYLGNKTPQTTENGRSSISNGSPSVKAILPKRRQSTERKSDKWKSKTRLSTAKAAAMQSTISDEMNEYKLNKKFKELQVDQSDNPKSDQTNKRNTMDTIYDEIPTTSAVIFDLTDSENENTENINTLPLSSTSSIVPKRKSLNCSGKMKLRNATESSKQNNQKRVFGKIINHSKSRVKMTIKQIPLSPCRMSSEAQLFTTPVRQSDVARFVKLETPPTGVFTRKILENTAPDIERPPNWKMRVDPNAELFYISKTKADTQNELENTDSESKVDFLNILAKKSPYIFIRK